MSESVIVIFLLINIHMRPELLDILYTPVEVPDIPVFDRSALDEWCFRNYGQNIDNRRDGKKITSDKIYPWNIVYVRDNHSWIDNFEKQFPQLADYFPSVFLLKEEDIRSIVLLPIKPNYTGAKYWHSDPDEIGLRLYLENNESDKDFLLFKPTIKKYYTREEGVRRAAIPPNGVSPVLQDKIYSVKLMKPTQAFYINNVRAVHTVNVESPDLRRLAVLIITNKCARNFFEPTEELIINSAKKFTEYVLWWPKPQD
jgi:hypothetical protein